MTDNQQIIFEQLNQELTRTHLNNRWARKNLIADLNDFDATFFPPEEMISTKIDQTPTGAPEAQTYSEAELMDLRRYLILFIQRYHLPRKDFSQTARTKLAQLPEPGQN